MLMLTVTYTSIDIPNMFWYNYMTMNKQIINYQDNIVLLVFTSTSIWKFVQILWTSGLHVLEVQIVGDKGLLQHPCSYSSLCPSYQCNMFHAIAWRGVVIIWPHPPFINQPEGHLHTNVSLGASCRVCCPELHLLHYIILLFWRLQLEHATCSVCNLVGVRLIFGVSVNYYYNYMYYVYTWRLIVQ